jgi:TonB family protein
MIRYVRPMYPKEAKRRHIQGIVKLRAVVSVRGELRNIEVLEGDPIFVPAALRAAKKCRFSPCLLNGDPVEPITE